MKYLTIYDVIDIKYLLGNATVFLNILAEKKFQWRIRESHQPYILPKFSKYQMKLSNIWEVGESDGYSYLGLLLSNSNN